MNDLETAVITGAEQLATTFSQITIASSAPTTIPLDCYQLWKKRAELHRPLRSTLELLPLRDHAWAIVNSVLEDANIVNRTTSLVRFVGQDMPFASARHLALAAYLTTTWSIYDRLANICGRLIGHESIGNNPLPTANPKLIDHFVRESKDKYKQHGFSLACILPLAYGWPASLSYVVRNWLVHEGLEVDGVALFRGNTLADSFDLSDAAIDQIEKKCTADGIQHSKSCLSADPSHPWYDKNILTILNKSHAEIDGMFCSLLNWAVASLTGQVEAFSARDR